MGGRTAEVESEEFLVFDFGGFLVEAGLLQAIGAVEQPAVLRHGDDEQVFNCVGGIELVAEVLEEAVVFGLIFAGEYAEGCGIVVEAVNGAVLAAGGATGSGCWAG